jgi:hypothetical protein
MPVFGYLTSEPQTGQWKQVFVPEPSKGQKVAPQLKTSKGVNIINPINTADKEAKRIERERKPDPHWADNVFKY